ncbi:MAG: type II toxin-antitoxin system RelE family toxin [Phycisphaerales bacterium]
MADVRITPEAGAQFEALPTAVKSRVQAVFLRLASWPDVSGAKPLRGTLAGQYRIRTGDYRVQFAVRGRESSATVTVNRIGHRDGFYEG